jgi:hypothetical protein
VALLAVVALVAVGAGIPVWLLRRRAKAPRNRRPPEGWIPP